MAFMQAAQACNLKQMARKADEYPYIKTVVDPCNPNTHLTQQFKVLQQHAVTLARENITEDLQELPQTTLDKHDYKHNIRKNNILSQIRRIQPGSTTTMGAIDREDGSFATDPEEIAKELTTHWRNTFQSQPINHHMLADWLATVERRTTDNTTQEQQETTTQHEATMTEHNN